MTSATIRWAGLLQRTKRSDIASSKNASMIKVQWMWSRFSRALDVGAREAMCSLRSCARRGRQQVRDSQQKKPPDRDGPASDLIGQITLKNS